VLGLLWYALRRSRRRVRAAALLVALAMCSVPVLWPSSQRQAAVGPSYTRRWLPKLISGDDGSFLALVGIPFGNWAVVRLDRAGRVVGEPSYVGQAFATDAIAFRGGVLIAAERDVGDRELSDLSVWWYDGAGNTLTEWSRIPGQPTNSQSAPSLIREADGGFTLYWSSHLQARIYAQRYDARGAPLGTVRSRSYGGSGDEFVVSGPQSPVSAVFIVDGGLHYLPRLSPEFDVAPVTLPVGTGGLLGRVILAANGPRAAVGWSDWRQRETRTLRLGVLDDRGLIAEPLTLDRCAGRRVSWPIALTEHDGNYLFLFHPGGGGVRSIQLDADGGPISPARGLGAGTLDMSNLVWSEGSFAAIYDGTEDDPCTFYFQRVSEDGSSASPPVCSYYRYPH
jgi:hypothetical protein